MINLPWKPLSRAIRIKSVPYILGIRMSRRTRLGFLSRIRQSASSPLAASAHTSKPSSFQSIIFFRPSRIFISSSAISTVSNLLPRFIVLAAFLCWKYKNNLYFKYKRALKDCQCMYDSACCVINPDLRRQ